MYKLSNAPVVFWLVEIKISRTEKFKKLYCHKQIKQILY